jgi:hypothetical protein
MTHKLCKKYYVEVDSYKHGFDEKLWGYTQQI